MDATREFDIVSPAFHSDPFPTLDRMRAEGAVVRITVPLLGRMWFAVPYDACATLLKDHESFARDPANAGSRTQARILRFLPRTIGLLALNMIGKDDPEHRRLRGLVDQAFQRRTIEAMKPTIRDIADRLLDKLNGRTQADLMSEFCRDLPLSVICAMLGLPEQDHDRFKKWLGGSKDTADIGAVIRAIPGVIRVVRISSSRLPTGRRGTAWRVGRCPARSRNGGAQAHRGRARFGDLPALRSWAGNHHALISGGLLALLSHEDQLRRLQNDTSLMPLCVEECLRYVSPVQMTKPRFATHDVVWQERQFGRGTCSPDSWQLRTAILTSSESILTGSTSRATRTHTSLSAQVCISALVFNSLRRRPRSRSNASSRAFQICASRLRRKRSSGAGASVSAL